MTKFAIFFRLFSLSDLVTELLNLLYQNYNLSERNTSCLEVPRIFILFLYQCYTLFLFLYDKNKNTLSKLLTKKLFSKSFISICSINLYCWTEHAQTIYISWFRNRWKNIEVRKAVLAMGFLMYNHS